MPCDWEGTVGLASHWPCVTDNSGITTYGLMASEREMSTLPIPSRSVTQFTFTLLYFSRPITRMSLSRVHAYCK